MEGGGGGARGTEGGRCGGGNLVHIVHLGGSCFCKRHTGGGCIGTSRWFGWPSRPADTIIGSFTFGRADTTAEPHHRSIPMS